MSNPIAWNAAHVYDAEYPDYAQGLRRGTLLAPDRMSMRDDGTVRCRVIEDDRVVYVWPWHLRPLDTYADYADAAAVSVDLAGIGSKLDR